jgi:hypothetical protein
VTCDRRKWHFLCQQDVNILYDITPVPSNDESLYYRDSETLAPPPSLASNEINVIAVYIHINI